MSNLARFMAYAAAFEQTFADDDWSRLEAFFTEDATYIVTGLPSTCELHGRDAIFRGIKKSLDGFDRKMEHRSIAPTAPPREEGNVVTLAGVARYRREGTPTTDLPAVITATFVDGRIAHMHDAFTLDAGATDWLARHASDLDVSYT